MAKKAKNASGPRGKRSVQLPLPMEIQNEQKLMLSNGLSEALGLPLGVPGQGFGAQLSEVDTLFKNNRWYLVSNMRQLLSQIYVEHGLVQTIVDIPVDDGMRGGVEIKSKQLSPEQIEELQSEMEQQEDLSTVGQALKWNRLYGGAAVIIMTDQDPKEPLNLNAIQEDSQLQFREVDLWELFWSQQNIDDGASLGSYEKELEHYDYYGQKLHKSRVMRMKGLKAPSFLRPRLRGWGVSIVEALVRSINQYLKANDLTFEVLDEFKIDIFKYKGLSATLLSPGGTAKVQSRTQLTNRQKSYLHAIALDSEDDYQQKELSFAGLAEVMAGIRMQVASDMRMPLTKLFGISAAGFNSGEDDIENYNAMVESQVRQKSKFDIVRIIELRCQKMFGMIPDDLTVTFKPLRVLSAEQEENVKTQKFNRVLAAKQAGEITSKEFRDACNKGNLLEIQLETDEAELVELEEESDSEGDDEGEGGEAPESKKSQVTAKDAPQAKA